MFLQLCVILFTGALCPSMHHRSHDRGSLFRGSMSRGVSVWESLSGGSLSGVSVQGEGGLCPGGIFVQGDLCPGGVSVQGSLCPGALCPGGGLCLGVSVQGGSLAGRPPYSNERAVRILLECILAISLLFGPYTILCLGINENLNINMFHNFNKSAHWSRKIHILKF